MPTLANYQTTAHAENFVRPGILLIGSEPVLSWLLHGALERAGFDVTIETCGERVISATECASFDAVIVDRDVRGIDGLDVVTFVRHRFPGTPILFLSEATGSLVAHAARMRGATREVEKPIQVDHLVRTLRQVLVQGVADQGKDPGGPRLWGVVLAGGRGSRLRPLVQYIHGESRPKQYACVTGSASLLRQTLDRVAPAIPERRTVVVALDEHAPYLAEESAHAPLPTVLSQPHDRGTAAGIFLAAFWVHRRDPDATVAIFPSDHFVGSAGPFIDHVREVARFVERCPDRIVLVGAVPDEPETEYGWIEPGDTVGREGAVAIRAVTGFVEKPSLERAQACLAAGALWNTLVLVARAATLVDAVHQLLPELHAALRVAVPFVGTGLERPALERAYAGPEPEFLERDPRAVRTVARRVDPARHDLVGLWISTPGDPGAPRPGRRSELAPHPRPRPRGRVTACGHGSALGPRRGTTVRRGPRFDPGAPLIRPSRTRAAPPGSSRTPRTGQAPGAPRVCRSPRRSRP
jgi:mannose-1-phosphate guanylyltransferase/ActR/RegA family two-component response regulator